MTRLDVTGLKQEDAKTLSPLGVRSACKGYTSLVVAAPSAELEASESAYTLRVALPGVLRHTIGVRVKENMLVVSGEWEGAGPGDAALFGCVYRAAFLPNDALPARLCVSLATGVFSVTVPCRAASVRR